MIKNMRIFLDKKKKNKQSKTEQLEILGTFVKKEKIITNQEEQVISEYESNGDRNKTLSIKNTLMKLNHT